MTASSLPCCALALALAAPAAARAHEAHPRVEPGRALAVRAVTDHGEALADAPFEVFSPAEPKVPFLHGRTDRNGYLAFVPDAKGPWRVRVADPSGHGFDAQIEAGAPADPDRDHRGWAPAARPLFGVLAIVAVFAALFALYRRTRAP